MKLTLILIVLVCSAYSLSGRLALKSTPYWNEIREVVGQINKWRENPQSLLNY